MTILVFVVGLVTFLLVSGLIMWLLVSIDHSDVFMSDSWRHDQKSQVKSVATMEHAMTVDGKVVLQHVDEETVRAVKTEIDNLRGGGHE